MPDPELIADEPARPAVTGSEVVYEGRIWDVRRETFEYNEHTLVREFIAHTGAVAVLALDEQGRVLLIRQYRHPIRQREWEIPAGLLDVAGESPLAAAQRELAEEADLTAAEWNVLAEFCSSPGSSSELIRIYLARGINATGAAFARTEEEADIEVAWVDLDEVVDGVLARRLQNPSLAIGAMAAKIARERGWESLGDPEEPWSRHPRFAG
ncbi:NUDIX domain-containing protein [Gryllotalpicola ginsengisoli]|uniref:NUDIX domain-containing protein n=1 Tax=Gryllotalpicola ginsengisoli TaxID=444608 RepID=UPI0003B3156A|nr:NUDIX hydrolase [Gryllotalpicola ginsengisoli]